MDRKPPSKPHSQYDFDQREIDEAMRRSLSPNAQTSDWQRNQHQTVYGGHGSYSASGQHQQEPGFVDYGGNAEYYPPVPPPQTGYSYMPRMPKMPGLPGFMKRGPSREEQMRIQRESEEDEAARRHAVEMAEIEERSKRQEEEWKREDEAKRREEEQLKAAHQRKMDAIHRATQEAARDRELKESVRKAHEAAERENRLRAIRDDTARIQAQSAQAILTPTPTYTPVDNSRYQSEMLAQKRAHEKAMQMLDAQARDMELKAEIERGYARSDRLSELDAINRAEEERRQQLEADLKTQQEKDEQAMIVQCEAYTRKLEQERAVMLEQSAAESARTAKSMTIAAAQMANQEARFDATAASMEAVVTRDREAAEAILNTQREEHAADMARMEAEAQRKREEAERLYASLAEERERAYAQQREACRQKMMAIAHEMARREWSRRAEDQWTQRLRDLGSAHVPVKAAWREALTQMRMLVHVDPSGLPELLAERRTECELKLKLVFDALRHEISFADDEASDMMDMREQHPKAEFLGDIQRAADQIGTAASVLLQVLENAVKASGSVQGLALTKEFVDGAERYFAMIDSAVRDIPTIGDLKMKYGDGKGGVKMDQGDAPRSTATVEEIREETPV